MEQYETVWNITFGFQLNILKQVKNVRRSSNQNILEKKKVPWMMYK